MKVPNSTGSQTGDDTLVFFLLPVGIFLLIALSK